MRDDARKSGVFKYRGTALRGEQRARCLLSHTRTRLRGYARQVAANDAQRAGAVSPNVHQSTVALRRHAGRNR